MKEDLLNLKLPKKYEEGLFKYELGLDNMPDWPEFLKNGWSFQDYMKLEKLVGIEHMKYILNDAIEDGEVSEEEIKELRELIEDAIKGYNEM